MTEDQEQARLCAWMTKNGIRFYAIPNGGRRSLTEAIKFKRCGVIPGVPDLCIPIPSGSYHGLYIELKRKVGGKASDSQIEWLAYLRKMGYFADIANGFDEARNIVIDYLLMTRPAA